MLPQLCAQAQLDENIASPFDSFAPAHFSFQAAHALSIRGLPANRIPNGLAPSGLSSAQAIDRSLLQQS